MSYNLNHTIQVAGAHTYSKCVAEVLSLDIGEKGHFSDAGETFDESPTQDTGCTIDQNLTELLGNGGFQRTGEGVCLRYPTSLPAENPTSDCMRSESDP